MAKKPEVMIRFNAHITKKHKKQIIQASKKLKVSQNEIVRLMLNNLWEII